MNNFDYQAFLNGTNDFNEMLPQDNSYNNVNQSMNNNLYGPYEGFVKGNLFNYLYDPYKNYTPMRLVPKSEQEEALLNIDQIQFAMHELNLYLDNYPNDINMINKFNEYQKMYAQLLNNYQSKYGPLQVNNPYMTTSPFSWTNDKWPWDGGNN